MRQVPWVDWGNDSGGTAELDESWKPGGFRVTGMVPRQVRIANAHDGPFGPSSEWVVDQPVSIWQEVDEQFYTDLPLYECQGLF